VSDDRRAAFEAIRQALVGLEMPWSESKPGLFTVTLPGTRKLTTECALDVGQHGVNVRAFVARNPDENHAGVYRWLLMRNLKLYGVAFSIDALGDIYLTGKLALASDDERGGGQNSRGGGRHRRLEFQRDP